MSVPRFHITSEVLALERLAAAVEVDVRTRAEGCGAVCTFLGIVRATHQGRRVRYLEYEAYAPMTVKILERIGAEIEREWPGTVVAIHHRIGRLEIGEASVAIAAAAAHRAESFQVCRYAIERVKQIAPVWKHEFFDNGDAWVEGAVADPDDTAARALARTRACV